METIVTRVLEKYGLPYSKVHAPQKGYRNTSYPITLQSGEMVNLIFYKREPGILHRIRDANQTSDFLADHDFATRQTIDRIIRLRAEAYERYVVLYTYLPGHTIAWEAYTMRHLKLLGIAMSHMHARLHHAPMVTAYVIHECKVLLAQMKHYFDDDGVVHALHRKLALTVESAIFGRLGRVLLLAQDLPEQQVLHMDFVRGNILFTGQSEGLRISGILDFEKTANGPRVFDIARTLAFLLVDCKFKSEDKIRKYFLYSGYNKRGAIAFSSPLIASFDLLEELIFFFLLHDFYKFLRHNPYEYLEQNEHFVQTVHILLKKGILKNDRMDLQINNGRTV